MFQQINFPIEVKSFLDLNIFLDESFAENESHSQTSENDEQRENIKENPIKFLKSNYLFPPRHFEINSGFQWIFPFVLARHLFLCLKLTKFVNVYFKMIFVIKYNFARARKLSHVKEFLNEIKKKRLKIIFRFSGFYSHKLSNLYATIFINFRDIKAGAKSVSNFFLLKFKNNKINATLQNIKFRNLTNVVSGFFIKYFNNQKSKKKSKAVKLLIAKYFRKIFIVSRLKIFNVIVNKNPVDIPVFFSTLFAPIISPFQDPYKEEVIEETPQNKFNIFVNYLFFKNCHPFHKKKLKKKGRIKRKILRKLVFENKVID